MEPRWGHTGLGQALNPMTSVFTREKWEMWTQRHRGDEQWKKPFDDGGWDWTDAAANLRTPRIAGNYQKLANDTLNLDFWPQELLLSATLFVVLYYGRLRKLIHTVTL